MTAPEPREDVAEGKQSCGCWLSGGQVSVRQLGCAEHDTKGEDVAVAEVGLTDAEREVLRIKGSVSGMDAVILYVERIIAERERAAVVGAWDEGWWKGQQDRDPTVLGYAENPYRGGGK